MKRPLLFVLLVALAITVPAQNKNGTNKAQELRGDLSKIQQKKRELQRQIQSKGRQVRAVAGDIREVDGRLTSVNERLEDTTIRLSRSRREQTELAGDLEIATQRLAVRKEQVRDRLRAMYMQGEQSVLSVLVGAETVGDFAARKALLERIARRDREVFEDLKSLRQKVADQKRRKDQIVARIASLKQQHEAEQDELAGVREEKAQLLTQLRKQKSALEREYDEFDEESRRIEAQIRAYQAAMRGKGEEVTPYKGSLMTPVKGRMSSGFGMRFHPVLKQNRMHNGLDIAAPSGTPIHAAAPGVVITAGWLRGYGNTVIIDHGGGLSTLYGHASRIYVRSGQRVSRGDRIAAVGATGLATGPHLHFETRVNGTPVNPRSRL